MRPAVIREAELNNAIRSTDGNGRLFGKEIETAQFAGYQLFPSIHSPYSEYQVSGPNKARKNQNWSTRPFPQKIARADSHGMNRNRNPIQTYAKPRIGPVIGVG